MIKSFARNLMVFSALAAHGYSGESQTPLKGRSQSRAMPGMNMNGDVPGRAPVKITPIQLQLIDIRTVPVEYKHVYSTVSAIIFGLMPIMWGYGTGSDVMKRIAAPMVGGMASATVLTLLLIPVIYFFWRSRQLAGPRL